MKSELKNIGDVKNAVFAVVFLFFLFFYGTHKSKKVLSKYFFSILMGFLMLATLSGCVVLKPVVSSYPEMTIQLRKKIYEDNKVTVTNAPAVGENALLAWVKEVIPEATVQSQHVRGLSFMPVEDYYRKSGADEAADLEADGTSRLVFGQACLIGTLVLVPTGLYEKVNGNQNNGSIFNFFGIALGVIGIWAQHDGTVNYVYPGIERFNIFLQKKLGLSSYTGSDGSGVKTSWAY